MKTKFALVALALSFASMASAQSLLKNGNFESGDYEGWATWKGSVEKIVMVDKPAQVKEGKFAVTVGGGVLFQDIMLTAGDVVTLSCYTKRVWGDNSTIAINSFIPGGKGQETEVSASIPENKKAYEQTVLEYKVKKSGKYRVVAAVGQGGGKFLMDDVTISIK